MDVFEPPYGPPDQFRRKAFRFASNEDLLRFLVGKGLDHGRIVTCHVTDVKSLVLDPVYMGVLRPQNLRAQQLPAADGKI